MRRKTMILALTTLLVSSMIAGIVTVSATESPTAPKTNAPPVAENLELSTYRGVAVSGRLSAVDPEGDLLSFTIVTEPRKGRINMTVDGCFVYTPLEGKRGKDYFGFKACDSNGNYSQEATVIIKIEKQSTKITYSDIKGTGGEYQALALAEHEIFVGECVGGNYVFDPTRPVSRGEFIAMSLKVADIDVLSGVTRTGFSDDSEIPVWVKPYVSTAVLGGVISGYVSEGSAKFESEAAISFSEAAVVLNRVLELTDVVTTSRFLAEAVPAWAYQATANLSACRVLPVDGICSMDSSVTRADAAQMLLAAAKIIESRR